jgi:small ligand-binding sensory domain FIST
MLLRKWMTLDGARLTAADLSQQLKRIRTSEDVSIVNLPFAWTAKKDIILLRDAYSTGSTYSIILWDQVNW